MKRFAPLLIALLGLTSCTINPYPINPYSGAAYYSVSVHYTSPSPVKCNIWVPYSCRPKTIQVPYGYGQYPNPYTGSPTVAVAPPQYGYAGGYTPYP